MEPQADVDALKSIYEAERQAERIVDEADEEAAGLLRKADAESAEILAAADRRLSHRRREVLAKAVAAAEQEAAAFLDNEKDRIGRWLRDRNDAVERIVERLLAMVLPS